MDVMCGSDERGQISIHNLSKDDLERWSAMVGEPIKRGEGYTLVKFLIGGITVKLFQRDEDESKIERGE